jgi:hypothetical protein
MRFLSTIAVFATAAAGCLSPQDSGVKMASYTSKPDVTGTIFTIVFENHDKAEVIQPSLPTFSSMAAQYGRADAYISNMHPSLLNYMVLTSGSNYTIGSDAPPDQQTLVDGKDNLADQLDGAGIKWRAYMESMGQPCNPVSNYPYVVNHNPFVYYKSLTSDPARCQDRVVDFDQNFAADLASNQYKYMWISPNMCNDMHDCGGDVADAWLKKVLDQIMASPGYQNGGAIFVLFDEGSTRILNAAADLPVLVISPKLASGAYSSRTKFDHTSYLATVEDIFDLPRLKTTACATPLNEFFAVTAGTGKTSLCASP